MIFSILLQHHFSNFPSISNLLFDVSKFQHDTQLCSKCSTSQVYSLNLRPICWWRVLFLLNAAFVMTIPDLISRVHLAPFVIMLCKYLKCSTFSSCFESIIICTGDGSLQTHYLSFFHAQFHSISSSSLNYYINLPCSTVSSFASSSTSPAYFTFELLVLLFWSLKTLLQLPWYDILCVTWRESTTHSTLF